MCLKRVEKKKLLGRHNKDIYLKSDFTFQTKFFLFVSTKTLEYEEKHSMKSIQRKRRMLFISL